MQERCILNDPNPKKGYERLMHQQAARRKLGENFSNIAKICTPYNCFGLGGKDPQVPIGMEEIGIGLNPCRSIRSGVVKMVRPIKRRERNSTLKN